MMNNIAKRLTIWAIAIAFLISIPLIIMQFTDEVQWDVFDFILMGVVLFGVGLAYELIAMRSKKTIYRFAFGIGLLGAFLLFWVNGAVGIIGNEGQQANLLYGAVYIVGLIGSFLSRFKSKGMARTLFVAALVQMLVPLVAIFIWSPATISWSPGVLAVFVLNGFFAMLFLISALLFNHASVSELKNDSFETANAGI